MKIVSLKAVKGREVYDGNGKLVSENDNAKIIHGTSEWTNFVNNLGRFNYSKVEIKKVVERNENELIHARKMRDELKRDFNASQKDVQGWEDKIKKLSANLDKEIDTSEIQKEVDLALIKSTETTKSANDVEGLKAENKSLTERLEKLEKMLSGDVEKKTVKPTVQKEEKTISASKSKLLEEFEKLYGQQADERLSVADLKKAIKAKKNK